ncbi:hypothetical protein ARMSODRAFT_1017589 [Armillaria solidipes]|uniref:Uncharacterized protein n=1 Tax=Armillaria solidipes TaxID=1076256 RepID=A0A2H3BIS8_9AGAR|nr:hypothetical protein ARMSODRAFT_1017589 [Armillaria solidipes]
MGKEISVPLHKLATYDKEGLPLVVLNTSWTGSAFHLQHDGNEMAADMHPRIIGASEPQTYINLKAVAFYTDVEHKVEPITRTSGAGSALALDLLVYLSLWFTNKFPCLDRAMPHVWGFAPVSAIPAWVCMGVDNGLVDEEEQQTYVHIEQVILQPSHSPMHPSSPVAPDSHRSYLLHGYAYVRGYMLLRMMTTIVGWLSMLSLREILLDGPAQEFLTKTVDEELSVGDEIVLGWKWNDA